MNKVYTIGRDPSCDVVISDNTDVVSRVHASLKVKGRGKYILVDQGRNGTYVNGIKMSPNEEIPVTRKDEISFAHVTNLDWDQIPKEKNNGLLWSLLLLLCLLIIGGIMYFVRSPKDEPVQNPIPAEEPLESLPGPVTKNDTVRDTVFIKESPKPTPKKITKPKKEDPASQLAPKKEEVVDALI